MAPHPTRSRLALRLLLVLLLAGCGRKPVEHAPAPGAPPVVLAGQKVVVLPVQIFAGIPVAARAGLDAAVWNAATEREPRAQWISTDALRQALRRSPGFAADPSSLPADPLLHHRERVAVEPLAGHLRRYSALTDARLILLPREARLGDPHPESGVRPLRLNAALIDGRTGMVVWWGEGSTEVPQGSSGVTEDQLAELGAALIRRLIAIPAP